MPKSEARFLPPPQGALPLATAQGPEAHSTPSEWPTQSTSARMRNRLKAARTVPVALALAVAYMHAQARRDSVTAACDTHRVKAIEFAIPASTVGAAALFAGGGWLGSLPCGRQAKAAGARRALLRREGGSRNRSLSVRRADAWQRKAACLTMQDDLFDNARRPVSQCETGRLRNRLAARRLPVWALRGLRQASTASPAVARPVSV